MLSPSVGATGTWSFVASLLPHPINFMYVDYTDSTTANTELNFMNSQLEGTGHFNKYASFIAMVQRWRLAYMSVTVYQDGPELANQGTMVVSQSPVRPRHYNFSYLYGANVMACPPVEHFDNEDRPDFSTSQSMPNSYFGRSKEGAYVPLKLTETCQHWVSDTDRVSSAAISREGNNYGVFVLPANQNMPGFPHVNLSPAYFNGSSGVHAGLPTSPMLNATWAHICAKNISVQTSFSFFVRCGIEMQVHPSSALAPQLTLSPPYDPVALDCYFGIARELKDGYPSEYNDLGRIWDALSAAAGKALPVMEKIPGLGMASTVIKAAKGAGDWMREQGREKPKQRQGKGKRNRNRQRKQPGSPGAIDVKKPQRQPRKRGGGKGKKPVEVVVKTT